MRASCVVNRQSTRHWAACRWRSQAATSWVRRVGYPPSQTLCGENAAFDLSHIQPPPMLGPVMHLPPLSQPSGLCWGKRLIQGGRLVGVEVVHHQHNLLGLRILHIDQCLHHLGKVYGCPSRCPLDTPLPGQRLAHHEPMGRALPLVRIIDALRLPWGRWKGRGASASRAG